MTPIKLSEFLVSLKKYPPLLFYFLYNINMSKITSPEILTCDINDDKPTSREMCPYKHQMLWEPTLNAESVIVWAAFGGDGLPEGLSLNPATGVISGTPKFLNLYHDVKDYTSDKHKASQLSSKPPGKNTGYDCTGNEYVSKGMIAYHDDNPAGPFTHFSFYIGLLTKWITPVGTPAISYSLKKHIIKMVPNNDPAAIAILYGEDHNNLVDDNGKKLTGEEYIAWRKSQGFDLDLKCK